MKTVYGLNKADLEAIGKGLLIALVGAAVTYGSSVVTKVDFGVYTPLVVAFWSVVANAIRKVADGQLGA